MTQTRRSIVVTGASTGFGRAIARAFGAHGDRVALLARGEERVLAGLGDAGGRVSPRHRGHVPRRGPRHAGGAAAHAPEGSRRHQPVGERPDNLDNPLPGDLGARGGFDASARSRSLEMWLRLHRVEVGAALAVATAGLLAVPSMRRAMR